MSRAGRPSASTSTMRTRRRSWCWVLGRASKPCRPSACALELRRTSPPRTDAAGGRRSEPQVPSPELQSLSVAPTGISGFSRALYCNWLWHQPLQLLVDAGEGLPLALGTHVFSPNVVAITHGHSDHVLGLPGFAGARRFGKGAQDKEWTVIFSAGSTGIEEMRQAIAGLWYGI